MNVKKRIHVLHTWMNEEYKWDFCHFLLFSLMTLMLNCCLFQEMSRKLSVSLMDGIKIIQRFPSKFATNDKLFLVLGRTSDYQWIVYISFLSLQSGSGDSLKSGSRKSLWQFESGELCTAQFKCTFISRTRLTQVFILKKVIWWCNYCN